MSVYDRYETVSKESSFSDVFQKAYRHSRRINILKFFLPLFALAIALIFCWYTFFLIPVSRDPVAFNNEEKGIMGLMMLNPKLEGYTRSYEPYWLKAEKVFQNHTHSRIIGLQKITAETLLGKKRRIFLDAQGGFYNDINGCLQLNKPFTITTNDGVIAQFMAADINLSEGQLNTNQRVNIQQAGLRLAANALQIREKGTNMYFHGGVHLVLGKQ
ncbi:LPS export ABC transporter periplasmic protein LptC [Bartonella sp. CB169]|uniref:LPS export ABC transporter periplasmic protein LptC n=1 Tax=Bartonella sp. CB169 TaxID=3112257 RepID=UPI00300E34F0